MYIFYLASNEIVSKFKETKGTSLITWNGRGRCGERVGDQNDSREDGMPVDGRHIAANALFHVDEAK